MKTTFTFLSFLWIAFNVFYTNNLAAQACCPKFILKDAVEICPPNGTCISDPVGGQQKSQAACKLTPHVYTVYPNDINFTYSWTVTGGTPTTFTGNPIVIVWGSGTSGLIKVVTSNTAVGGNCVDSITQQVCLIDGPQADFTLSNDTVCANSPVYFSNTSVGGSVYLWNFGDGTTSSLATPLPHTYSLPGQYTVTLRATDMGAGHWIPGTHGEVQVPCGCSDTVSKVIVVLPGSGPVIETDCCFGTVCAGDTSSLCTPMVCANYTWSVTGGTIISPPNAPCIKVKWNAVYSGPTTVTLQACPSSSCPGSTTINVPVLYPNLPINGPAVLCVGGNGSYSLPSMPGTYYTWTVTGGFYTFNKADRNVALANISFSTPGTFWVKCNYNNPLAGCSGVDSIQVDILPKFTYSGDETVCEGSVTTYTANGAANWSVSPPGPIILSGNGTASINVMWAPPGNYTIIASPVNLSAFCNDSVFKKVEVKAKPILGNIVGTDSICPGNKFTYSITSNVSGSPFVWTITTGTGQIQSYMGADKDSIVVQFSLPGPWTLSVYQNMEITPGVFCPSLTKTLNVYPFPLPTITGPTNVCIDAVTTFYAPGSTPPGGFQWSIIPPSRGTIQSGQGTNSVTVLWHGPPTTATLSVTTCAGIGTHNVVINGSPGAVVATYNIFPVFCLGTNQTLILSTPLIGGYSYQWYQNNNIVPGGINNTLSINIASLALGTYQYYVLVTQNGCPSKSNTINVIIQDCFGGPGGNGCDVVALFTPTVTCSNQVPLSNQSYVISPSTSTITGYLWTVSGPGTPSFSPNATATNPVLIVNASGTFSITLTVTSSSGCVSTLTQIITVLLPAASFTFTTPVCLNSLATFVPTPNNINFNYAWNFGDTSTSFTAVTQHAYTTATPSAKTVTLTITDQLGCTAVATGTVNVNPTPTCTITASDTAFCPGGFVTLTACGGMGSYQWYKDGTLISGATSMTYTANRHGEYWVEVTSAAGCPGKSNKLYIFMYSLPVAKIKGASHICAHAGTTTTFFLNTVFNTNYIYSWSSIPAGATFSPPNGNYPMVSLTLPLVLPVTYQFVVSVTDTTTYCVATDTVCITFYKTPPLVVPTLNLCEGTPVTLTPAPINTIKYSYQWNNGATTPVITVSTPGFYSLTITDKATGCDTTANAGFIFGKPDLSLFPHGCKSMCNVDTIHLYIPLPLNALFPNNTYPNAYPVITWLDNGGYAGSGQYLAYPSTTGNHQISVVVQNSFGCVDTAGVFCLKDSCCNIVLGDIVTEDASCLELANGWFKITLDPSTVGGPFTITSSPLVPPLPATIVPGIPYTVSNLAAGTYIITITGPGENCIKTYDIVIRLKKEHCCFAEADSLFTKITSNITYNSNTVWDGKYYIDNNVIVTVSNGAILDITNVDVVFGSCAGIDFKNGALLRSNNSVYRPCYIDGTWRGLRFVGKGKFDNIINESTFKNAEVALYFQGKSDGVISNNLFSNCNYGVRVDTNTNFSHPIDGNRFVTEQFFPVYISCYPFVNNSSTYAIYTTSSRFLRSVSQNNFVNTKATSLPRTFGIYQINSGGLFSENTFTDLTYSIYLNTAVYTSIIENNEIEVNVPAVSPLSTIYVDNSNSPLIEINKNKILNNFHQYNSFSAIYALNSANISMVNNNIEGFRYGIIASKARNFQISNNTISDCDISGIYFYGRGTDRNYITCNEVKMRNFANTRGIYTVDLSTKSEVSSNCIDDCYTSMDFKTTTTGLALPKIRNNSLYNYNFVGINVSGYSGNIGTAVPFDPGLNTLWSNYNSAIDINSNSTITVADNFGMFNISFPQVQITSNRPYHSTASCAHQIFNMPSQGNLNINYTCDNFKRMTPALSGSGGLYTLDAGYRELLQSSENQFNDASLILATIQNPDINLLNEILGLTNLTDNEKSVLKYNFYYNKADYQNARLNMNRFSPDNPDETDYKMLRLYDLDVIKDGLEALSGNVIQNLGSIEDKRTINSNFAIALLNNTSTYRDYIFDEPTITDVVLGSDIKHVADGENYLIIYPNPATNKIHVEIIYNSMQDGKIQMFDLSGKLITDFTVNIVAGGIDLDIQHLSKGLYFITITDPGSGFIKAGKFVKN